MTRAKHPDRPAARDHPAAAMATALQPLIVGIGASAGGLAAFKTFFTHMPPDTGMAVVLVQHLDPQHHSMLVELLQPQTRMPIVEATDGVTVAANHVYVIPRDATLTIEAGHLRVAKPAPPRQQRRPIDTFFCSLAEDQTGRAVAIVLSGIGNDGSLGVATIKEHGGLTLAQAEFDHHALSGMPQSAAATGFVDHVLPIEAMPAALINYQRHLAGVAGHKDDDGARTDTKEYLAQIIALLRARNGHDFRGYKESTVTRRVQRRMQVLQIESAGVYAARLAADPRELDLLFRELLISVTEFFRNPDAFDALAHAVVHKLIENKSADDQVRVWVPGCATGEEVYSIAILLREATDRRAAPKIVIFGTDIDADAVATARAARYRELPPGLSAERFARWFTKDGDDYRPVKGIRDLCVFSQQSLIKDPPFSKLDLISCRNVLIYLNSDLQHRVMQTAHYALKPGGYLFLGPAESVTREANLFTVLDKKHRILQRRDVGATLPGIPARVQPGIPLPVAAMRTPGAEDAIDKLARRALQVFSPAYFVIDAKNEIIRFSGAETGQYLEPSGGVATFDLFAILRKDLRQAVRAALHQARAENRVVMRENLPVRIDGESRLATVIAQVIGDNRDEGLCLIAFRDVGPGAGIAISEPATTTPAAGTDLQALERELRETKAQLHTTGSDLELNIEESKSASEEYQSINEELQSSNEELQTAKEEMQSVNEELETINAELHTKNAELTHVNSDVQNLIDSTEIAIVFLDQALRIKSFTPAIANIFPLRDSDRGRPLTDIVSTMIGTDLVADMAEVQRTLAPVERQVEIRQTAAPMTLLMRMRPYRTIDKRIDGLVVMFTDIDAITIANAVRARFAALARASGDAILGVDMIGAIDIWSEAAERLLGYTSAEMVGRHVSVLAPKGHEDRNKRVLARLYAGELIEPFDTVCQHKDGHIVHVALKAAQILSQANVPIGLAATLRDIAERRQDDAHKAVLHRELSHRVKNTLAIVQSMARQTLRSTPEPDLFAPAFEGRLHALAAAHNILTEADWAGAEFGILAREQLAPFIGDNSARIDLKGPSIMLRPETATSVGLVLHELATNASKYGSLSLPAGQVSLVWRVDAAERPPCLHVVWRETGGPKVSPRVRRGFGSQLIERSGLEARQTFAPAGLICELDIVLYATQPAGTS